MVSQTIAFGEKAVERAKEQKKKRVLDITGLCVFALTMLSLLMLLDQGTGAGKASNVFIILLAAAFLLLSLLLVLVERYWATDPVIPVKLLQKPGVGFQVVVEVLLMCAQIAVRQARDPSSEETEG